MTMTQPLSTSDSRSMRTERGSTGCRAITSAVVAFSFFSAAALLAGCGGSGAESAKDRGGNVVILGDSNPSIQDIQRVCGDHPVLGADQFGGGLGKGNDTRIACAPSTFQDGRTTNLALIDDSKPSARKISEACGDTPVVSFGDLRNGEDGPDTIVACATPEVLAGR